MFSGKNGSLLFHIAGDAGGDLFGASVDGIGDINNDGHPDVIVGAPQPSLIGLKGYVKIVSGKTGKQLAKFTGAAIRDQFGAAVRGAGDMNGDKVPDFLVSAPGANTDTGYVVLFSGKTGKVLRVLVGTAQNDAFGLGLDGGVDVTGDGTPEILVGAPGRDAGYNDNGEVSLFNGKTGKLIRAIRGTNTFAKLGTAVAFGGDVNKDGTTDLLAGAPGAKVKGGAFVFSGKDGTQIHAFHGDANGDELGGSIAYVGDVNGDGHGDILAGAPKQGSSKGMARVFSGKDLTLWTDVHRLSLKAVGTQKMTLAAGAAHANRMYHVFGSATGSTPGIQLNGVHIPLNYDMYSQITLAYANSAMLGAFRGKLDSQGMATATFNVPANLPSLSDLTLTHSYIVYDASGTFYMASNAATLRLEN